MSELLQAIFMEACYQDFIASYSAPKVAGVRHRRITRKQWLRLLGAHL